MHHLLTDIGISVLSATIVGLVAYWLRQPLVLGYLIAGALIGPQLGLALVTNTESIEVISEIGLVLLLFIVGLEIDSKRLLRSGRHLLIVGFGQFPVCIVLGCIFFKLIGYPLTGERIDGLYLALLWAFSSDAIVVKVLFDKRELGTLPGQLTLGVLVLQDIYAILIFAVLPNLSDPQLIPIATAVLSTVLLVGGGFFVSRFVLSRIFKSIAHAPEMTLAVSIGWCSLMAGIGEAIGLSMEMGALVAGVSISLFPYSIHVTAKALPLRDFFLTLFFVSLGMKMTPPTLDSLGIVAVVSLFLIASRFLSVYPILKLTGAGRRAAFLTSLNLCQLSEFSVVLATLGVQLGHIGQATLMLAIYTMAVLAVVSSYSIRLSHPIYSAFNNVMERLSSEAGAVNDREVVFEEKRDIVLLGYHRVARALVEGLQLSDPELLERIQVIDFNPVSLDELRKLGIAATFGDLNSLDTLDHAHLDEAEIVISSIPDMLLRGTDNLKLLRSAKALAPDAVFVATADDPAHGQRLLDAGADVVMNPFDLGGDSLRELLASFHQQTPAFDPEAGAGEPF